MDFDLASAPCAALNNDLTLCTVALIPLINNTHHIRQNTESVVR